jgi:hypothetical protein
VADLNQLAARLVREATGEEERKPETVQARSGRKGGLKGGLARAAKLSPQERSEIAKKAARARWTQP